MHQIFGLKKDKKIEIKKNVPPEECFGPCVLGQNLQVPLPLPLPKLQQRPLLDHWGLNVRVAGADTAAWWSASSTYQSIR